MSHPSDETFLDEMAQAAALAKEALDYTRSFTDDEWLDAVEGLKSSATPEAVLRLVALARRAPALTCGTCKHFRRGDTQLHRALPTGDRCCHPSEAHPMHWQETVDTFGCIWHAAPAPPEARP